MATMNVRDSDGATQAIEKPLAPGRSAAAASRPVAVSDEDLAAIEAITDAIVAALGSESTTVLALLQEVHGGEYEFVGAEATAQVLGAVGGAGDFLERLIIIPLTTSPGAVALLDDDGSMTVFAGGASSVATLAPIEMPIRARSVDGAWNVTTGTNVAGGGSVRKPPKPDAGGDD